MNEPWSDCGEGKWWLDNVVKMHVWRGVCLAQCLAFRAAAAAGRPSTAAPALPRPAPATAGGGLEGGLCCEVGGGMCARGGGTHYTAQCRVTRTT